MDYKARFYDPYLNRWTQPDTIVPSPYNPQAWDRYSYALNNPVRYNDPSGHCVLVEDDAHGLCVLTNQQSSSTGIQVVHGGSVFPNRVEVGLANTYLTGQSKWLYPILPSPFLRLSMQRAGCQLGEPTCANPRLLLISAMFRPGYPFDDEYVPVPPDMGDPDCPGCGYVNPYTDARNILMPSGEPIGTQAGSDPSIRTIPSDLRLMQLFNTLTVDGTPNTPATYKGIGYDLPNGGWVGLRQSVDYGLTMDVNIPGIPINKIHLPMP